MSITNIIPNGDLISLKTNSLRHFGNVPTQRKPGDFMQEFTKALEGAVENVNDLQIKSDKLSMQMITKPNSIDAHTVMIAAEQAQLALSLTKKIVDKSIESYKAITSLR